MIRFPISGSKMRQALGRIEIKTRGQGLVDFTPKLMSFVQEQGIENGLLTVFVRHTSASLVIQENADPDVLWDLNNFFKRIVPEGSDYRHSCEGPDDMPAHIKAALTQTSIGIPVMDGRLCLGTWQGVYLFEHRAMPHTRQIALHLLGQ